MKIFYAWQSDRNQKLNRYFIRDALKLAIKPLAQSPDIDDAPQLDHDTKDIPGSPHIAEVIFGKIRECGIFVADVSFVARTEPPSHDIPPKLVPNPNVLIELGIAASTIGWERIILVMNTAFGAPDILPFDLRHRRHPIQYEFADADDAGEAKLGLADDLRTAIKLIIESDIIKPKEAVSLSCSPALVTFGAEITKVLSITVTNVGARPVVISGFGLIRSDNWKIIFPPRGLVGGWSFPKRLQEAEYFSILVNALAFREIVAELRSKHLKIMNIFVTDSLENKYVLPFPEGLDDEMIRD